MKYIKILSAILILFVLAVSVANSKPLPALSVKMQWQGDLVIDMPMTLALSVFSHVSTDDLAITLSLPAGVTLLEGQVKEVISIKGSKPAEKTYTVQISKTAVGFISAEVRMNGNNSNAQTTQTSFYAVAALPVSNNVVDGTSQSIQKISPRDEAKQDFKRVQRDGVWLREYKLP